MWTQRDTSTGLFLQNGLTYGLNTTAPMVEIYSLLAGSTARPYPAPAPHTTTDPDRGPGPSGHDVPAGPPVSPPRSVPSAPRVPALGVAGWPQATSCSSTPQPAEWDRP